MSLNLDLTAIFIMIRQGFEFLERPPQWQGAFLIALYYAAHGIDMTIIDINLEKVVSCCLSSI